MSPPMPTSRTSGSIWPPGVTTLPRRERRPRRAAGCGYSSWISSGRASRHGPEARVRADAHGKRTSLMVSRRQFLTIGAGGVVSAAISSRATAQMPKRGGTLSLRTWDPPHFDHILAHAYKTHVVTSFTHSRLLRHKAGPGIRPGSFPIEGDLAESWQQTSETSYVFKLRKGVRFHAKPPVNGRELTADDVRYTFEHIVTEKGSDNVSMFRAIAKIEALDRYSVKFTLKEPFAWFLDMIANPGARRGREILSPRPRRGQAAPRCGRPSERYPGQHLLRDLRVHDARRHHAAPPQGPQGGGHRRRAGPEGIRRVSGHLPAGEIRF